jgi:hypothetical protein
MSNYMQASGLTNRLGSYENHLGESFTEIAKGFNLMMNPLATAGVNIYRAEKGLPGLPGPEDGRPAPGSDEHEEEGEKKSNTAIIAIVVGALAIGAVLYMSKKRAA